MRHEPSSTSPQYEEQFNKELAKQLKIVREAQPNHIPVFAMKYKNATKHLVEELQQALALFPKKFQLRSVYDIIQKQSLEFCHQKLKEDAKVKNQGSNFKIPEFYLYTISMIKPEEDKIMGKSTEAKSSRPIGIFVKLDLEMTFEEAFQKYGRENVLTVVYTDAKQVNTGFGQTAVKVQKWLTRVIIFILILVLIPFLMKSEPENFDSTIKMDLKSQSQKSNPDIHSGKINAEDSLDFDNSLEIDIVETEIPSFGEEKAFNYDEESI